MGRKSEYTVEQKLEAVEDVLLRHGSVKSVCRKHKISSDALKYWVVKYKALGTEGLMDTHRNAKYGTDIKIEVFLYLKKGHSVSEASTAYLIPRSVIRWWLKRYTYQSKGGGSGMAGKGGKGVKKHCYDIGTMEKAAKECIESGYDYKGVAEKYSVKYGALYSWVKKYRESGRAGLVRKNVGRKSEKSPELTEAEKLRIENEKKDEKIRELEAVIEVLKKKRKSPWIWLQDGSSTAASRIPDRQGISGKIPHFLALSGGGRFACVLLQMGEQKALKERAEDQGHRREDRVPIPRI